MNKINTYVISLKASKRRECTQRYVVRKFEYFNAFNALENELRINDFFSREFIESKYSRKIAIQEYGCAISHYQVIKKFYNSKSDFALILEDDCKFTENTNNYVEYLMHLSLEKKVPIDMVSLFSGCAVVSNTERIKVLDNEICRVVGRLDHTVGYFISKEGAKKYIENNGTELKGLADWPFDMKKWDSYVFKDNCVEHINLGSFIDDSRHNKFTISRLFINSLSSALRSASLVPIKKLYVDHVQPLLTRKKLLSGYSIVSHKDSFK